MYKAHEGTETLVEEQPVVEEKKKSVAGGPLKARNFNLLCFKHYALIRMLPGNSAFALLRS